jgi:hypothetical protein
MMRFFAFILLTCGSYFLLRQLAFFSFLRLIHVRGSFGWQVQGSREKFERVRRRLKIARITTAWLISAGLAWWVVSTRMPNIH